METEELERLAASITPGPWAVDEINSGVTTTANDLPPCRTFGYGCGNDFVCDLNDGEYHEYTDGGEQEANARAIALLPELLAEVIATRRASGQATSESVEPVDLTANPDLNLASWMEARRSDIGPWADYLIQEVRKLEKEIEIIRAHPQPLTVEAAALVQKHLHDIINCGNCSGSRHSARLALRSLAAKGGQHE